MSTLLELLRAAKASGDYQPLIEAIPYNRWLGIGYELAGDDWVSVLRFHDKLVGNPAIPALHGGTLGALLETTAIFQLFWEAETVALPKTITLTIDYLRSAAPRDTFAKGIITKHGRRVVTVRAVAWQDDRDKPVATANVHLLVTPPPER
ncbi:MAG: PaaI family thioesterase [Deltaproteobacteria bacterium]|nr:PaaI family thioesterase [Deltaproteobacteria bacterium]